MTATKSILRDANAEMGLDGGINAALGRAGLEQGHLVLPSVGAAQIVMGATLFAGIFNTGLAIDLARAGMMNMVLAGTRTFLTPIAGPARSEEAGPHPESAGK